MLEKLLAPFGARMSVSARGFLCLGSIAGARAGLARLRGDLETAVRVYEEAIERDERGGAMIWAMHHRRRLAVALIDAGRGKPAGELLARVRRGEAPAMGLPHLAALASSATGS